MIIASKHRKESDSRAFDSLTCPKHSTRTYTTDAEAIVSDSTARYDVFLGYDVMVSARMAMSSDTHTIRWGDFRQHGRTRSSSRLLPSNNTWHPHCQPYAAHGKGNLQCQLLSSGHTFVGPTAGAFIAEAEGPYSSQRQRDDIGKTHGHFQLSEGSVLMQQEKPVAFFARNLTSCFVVVPYLCITSTTNQHAVYFKPSAFLIGCSSSRNIAHSLII
jgi:hypothetical protein